MKLPRPRFETLERIVVLRDDLIEGGTKRRVLGPVMDRLPAREFVFAGPALGHAQLALALAARDVRKRTTIFLARRTNLHPLTQAALAAGAKIVQVNFGRLNVLQSRARRYCAETGALFLPLGIDIEEARAELADIAQGLPIKPREVWTVAGSGMLTRSLQQAWPAAEFHAVMIGREASNIGRAARHVAPEAFEEPARLPPPFPSAPNYDAKAWRFIERHAASGALFWNVAA